MFAYSAIISLVVCINFKENQARSDGIRFLPHPVSIPNSETSRFEPRSVQFNVQNAVDGTYHFGYDIDTEETRSFREEKRDASGLVSGKYGYLDPDGILRVVEYEADSNGFRSRSLNTQEPNFLRMKNSNLPIIGPIPKPLPHSYKITREDYFNKR